MKSTSSVAEVAATANYRLSEAKASNPIVDSPIVASRRIDTALEKTADLIDDENYKKWFAKQAIRLGPDRYLGLARDAREGKQPARLFVYLLRSTT